MFPLEEGFGEPWFPIVKMHEVTLCERFRFGRSEPNCFSFQTRIRAWPAIFRTAPYDV